ncbi:MAG TPA: hypothetical protein PKL77_09405 [Candidatus Omnitrophota bacterium]|nr:hypothetical protein [Candidatus Omnitrophota bacterium]
MYNNFLKCVLVLSICCLAGIAEGQNSNAAVKVQSDDSVKKNVNERLKNASCFVAYKSSRLGDASLCYQLSQDNVRDCWEIVQSIKNKRFAAQNRCDELPANALDARELCFALNGRGCASTQGYKNAICQGVLDKDAKKIINGLINQNSGVFILSPASVAGEILSLYYGYKGNSERDCLKFSDGSLRAQAECNVLFGANDFENNFDKISKDILIVIQAKDNKNMAQCDQISNPQIRRICKDRSVISLDDVVRDIWK